MVDTDDAVPDQRHLQQVGAQLGRRERAVRGNPVREFRGEPTEGDVGSADRVIHDRFGVLGRQGCCYGAGDDMSCGTYLDEHV